MLFVLADAADGRNATAGPDVCQLSEFDILGWHSEWEEMAILSINGAPVTPSSTAQFNMGVITLCWCTVRPFVIPQLHCLAG